MRNFNSMSPITLCFNSKTSPLIKIDVDRNLSYHNTKTEKLDVLKKREKTDKFIISWSGKWSTDVFEVTEEDIDMVLNPSI